MFDDCVFEGGECLMIDFVMYVCVMGVEVVYVCDIGELCDEMKCVCVVKKSQVFVIDIMYCCMIDDGGVWWEVVVLQVFECVGVVDVYCVYFDVKICQ